MNYTQIESLVKSSKQGNTNSKELLAEAFKPFILNISKRTFINGYDFYDIQNECFKILFHCLSLYNPETSKFVAYATNGIRKSLNDLIKKSKNRSHAEGHEALILCGCLEHVLPSEIPTTEEILCEKADYENLFLAINKLNSMGIKVFQAIQGDLEKNLEAFKGNKLKEFPSTHVCNHDGCSH